MLRHRLQSDFRFALITLFGTIASLCLLPIAAYRFATGAVATGIVDLFAVGCIASAVVYAWRGGSIERAGLFTVTACGVACVAVAHLMGLAGLLWVYPVVAANFLLVRPRRAVLGSTLTVAAAAAVASGMELPGTDPMFLRAAFAVTAMVVGLFAYIFARRTETQHAQLQMLVTRDPLTGASNRRAMEQELPIAIEAARRTRAPVGLIVVDIDDFKRINDTHGHEAGDHVLVDFARLVAAATRKGDRLFRYGGEEFVLLLPGLDAAHLAALAEMLRARVEAELRVDGRPVTASIGTAAHRPGEPYTEWLARADAAMYRAKREGRNRVIAADPPGTAAEPLRPR
ncbi:MAG TPA: GGDEF domain-containing protein [Lysobacter sp.]